MTPDLKLYSLLYIDRDETKHTNLKARNADPIDIYLRCAALLHASCRAHGQSLTLVTNRSALVAERLSALGLTVEVVGHPFTRDVPRSIPFYAAHFKLDVFRAFGEGAYGDVVGLVDLDAVLVRPLPRLVPRDDELLVYDISSQVVPEYGAERIAADLSAVGAPSDVTAHWYGGEFIAGCAPSFRALSSEIEALWPRYKNIHQDLHHIGDEMVVSAALATLKQRGFSLPDAGEAKLVSRWWTARTNFQQVPQRIASEACLWHLPADKPFLASCDSTGPFDAVAFARKYRSYARSKLWQRRALNLVSRLTGSRPKHVGRLN